MLTGDRSLLGDILRSGTFPTINGLLILTLSVSCCFLKLVRELLTDAFDMSIRILKEAGASLLGEGLFFLGFFKGLSFYLESIKDGTIIRFCTSFFFNLGEG